MNSKLALLAFASLALPHLSLAQTELFELTASDAGTADLFGDAVALDGDRAVVGAPGENHGMKADVGKAYVIDATNGQELFKLTAADDDAGDQFGFSVAVRGNLILVGAPYDDEVATNAGAAYVFDLTTGQQLMKLTASDGEAWSLFGSDVAVDGNRAIIGAPESGPLDDEGAAYVFDLDTGLELFKLTASDSKGLLFFGTRVALSGDLAAVATYPDRVYAYDLTSGQELYKLTSSELYFGYSIALQDDRLVVSAWGTLPETGTVYVFDATTGTEVLQLETEVLTAAPEVGISGERVVVGGVGNPRSARVFDLTTMEQVFELFQSEPENGDSFAFGSIAVDGPRVLVPARRRDPGGAAYLFQLVPLGVSYCGPAVPNSTGLAGVITAVGSDVANYDNVWLAASQLPPNSLGYFLVGPTQGFVSNPGGSQGNLCLAGTIGRYSDKVFNAGQDGRSGLELDLTAVPFLGGHTIVAGETWNWTTWFRDKNPQNTSNFTDAVSVTFQ